MKSERFKLVCLGNRGGMFYCKDTQTGSRTSLKTFDRKEAERLVFHKNEANGQPHINRRIGLAYLAAADPELTRRTWRAVMEDILKDKHGPTLVRTERAMRDEAFKLIEGKLLVETRAEDLLEVLRAGGTCTNVFLRRLQNHALDLGWLPVAALPKKLFPKVKHQQKRAITAAEHALILAREGNLRRGLRPCPPGFAGVRVNAPRFACVRRSQGRRFHAIRIRANWGEHQVFRRFPPRRFRANSGGQLFAPEPCKVEWSRRECRPKPYASSFASRIPGMTTGRAVGRPRCSRDPIVCS